MRTPKKVNTFYKNVISYELHKRNVEFAFPWHSPDEIILLVDLSDITISYNEHNLYIGLITPETISTKITHPEDRKLFSMIHTAVMRHIPCPHAYLDNMLYEEWSPILEQQIIQTVRSYWDSLYITLGGIRNVFRAACRVDDTSFLLDRLGYCLAKGQAATANWMYPIGLEVLDIYLDQITDEQFEDLIPERVREVYKFFKC